MLLAGWPRSKRRGNYVVVHVDGLRLCLRNAATNGPVVHPSGDIYISMERHGGMILTGKTEELGVKLVPVPLSPIEKCVSMPV
jgi:hypothetical protein